MSAQSNDALLQELIRDAKKQIRNGFIFGLVGLFFAFSGFFSFAVDFLGFSVAWLAVGIAGAAMVIVAFYVMIRADLREANWKRDLVNVTSSVIRTKEPEHPADNGDKYFDENYEKWKNPFEEDNN